MLGSFPISLLAGAIFGFLSGLGVGGGSILVVYLTLILQMPTECARCINLLFFIPAALCACFFRWKQGSLPLKRILLPALLGCILAGSFSFVGSQLDTTVIRKLFGLLFIGTGLRELFYRPKEFK